MAPSCLATIFEGDNGAATSRGVNATEIRVAVLGISPPSPTDTYGNVTKALFEYFNNTFELYGRRLVPVFVGGSTTTALDARARAGEVAAQGSFAALTALADWGTPQSALPQALARDGVISVVQNMGSWWTDRTLFDPLHPYVWSVYPSSEDVQANLAAFACASLAGRLATFAGDASLRDDVRRFAVVSEGAQSAPSSHVVADALSDCTSRPTLTVDWAVPSGTTSLQTGLAKLRDGGVTTVVCVCEGFGVNAVAPTAHQAGFHPEWILAPGSGAGNNDDEYMVQLNRAGQSLAPPLRLSAGPRLLPVQTRPWFRALQSTRPDLLATTSSAGSVYGLGGLVYEQLLVLASGIQAAGPTLNPDTFAAGLMSTQFPNPGAGQSPYWQPSAGFGPGDHSFFDDYTIGWWSDAQPSLNYPATGGAQGSWCYVGRGSRFHPGTYPTDVTDQLFNPNVACR